MRGRGSDGGKGYDDDNDRVDVDVRFARLSGTHLTPLSYSSSSTTTARTGGGGLGVEVGGAASSLVAGLVSCSILSLTGQEGRGGGEGRQRQQRDKGRGRGRVSREAEEMNDLIRTVSRYVTEVICRSPSLSPPLAREDDDRRTEMMKDQ